MRDDVFDGDMEHRLRRAARRLRTASLDAQARDWTTERPDRIGFARLGQAHHEVSTAADRYASPPPTGDWTATLINLLAWAGTTVLILLSADRPAAPLTTAVAIVAGAVAAQVAFSALQWARRQVARRARTEPAAIDDPYLYTDLTRRLEACAAAARAEKSEKRRAAAAELGRALDWISAARE